MKLHYVLQIRAIKICQICCFGAVKCSARDILLNYDMNAIPSNTVDGKSMTCMQFSNSSSVTTVLDNAWTEISTEKIKDFKGKLLTREEESSRHKTHATIVYNLF